MREKCQAGRKGKRKAKKYNHNERRRRSREKLIQIIVVTVNLHRCSVKTNITPTILGGLGLYEVRRYSDGGSYLHLLHQAI